MTLKELKELIHDWHQHKSGIFDYPRILILKISESHNLIKEATEAGYYEPTTGTIEMPEAQLKVCIYLIDTIEDNPILI